jgi:predicted HTH transcriptional regulator
MQQAGMVPPTFESNHSGNTFTTRLLLHHFLSEDDIKWLNSFEEYQLSDAQKIGLIFLREVGAIDNSSYRQLNGYDVLKASSDLRALRDFEILDQKGKGRSTYYISGLNFKLFDKKSSTVQKTNLTPQISSPTNRLLLLPMEFGLLSIHLLRKRRVNF